MYVGVRLKDVRDAYMLMGLYFIVIVRFVTIKPEQLSEHQPCVQLPRVIPVTPCCWQFIDFDSNFK